MLDTEYKELSSQLNPSELTARAGLMGGAANGEKYAIKLSALIEKKKQFEEKKTDSSDNVKDELFRFSSAYGTFAWVRNKISDRLFNALKMSSFVDLGCGFNPRGLEFMDRKQIHYYGIDLPAVSDKMMNVMLPILSAHNDLDRIKFISADITDLHAIKSSIRRNESLFITTEGLMMYLTESEMTTAIHNIAALLSEYGGVWFTGDHAEKKILGTIITRLFNNNKVKLKEIADSVFSEKWRSILFENSFMTLNGDMQTEFFAQYGLKCRTVPVSRYINDLYISENILSAFDSAEFFLIQANDSDKKSVSDDEHKFSLDLKNDGKSIIFIVKGRLDAISAPKLVKEYEIQSESLPKLPLIIDMEGCTYISSAGIRAVIILYKHTAAIKDGFSLRNIRPEVLDILKRTALTNLMTSI